MNPPHTVSPRLAVLWVTNAAAPYRRPVWESLANDVDLSISLLQTDRSLESAGRRGDDWKTDGEWPPPGRSIRLHRMRTVGIRRGETEVYALAAPPRMRRVSALVLGGWESPAYWQLLLIAKLRGIKCVGFYESTLSTNRHRSGPLAWARKLFMSQLHTVVVPGPAARRALESFGVRRERIFEGFNAVDVEAFAAASGLRSRTNGHRYIYVGQIIARKNIENLLAAFAEARAPDDTLTVLGSGELLAKLRVVARELGLAQAIEFRDPVPNAAMPVLLASFDTLVLPSLQEVWGLVVNEALAAGMHVVVSREAGVAESISDMQGAYITGTDVDSICDAMARSRRDWAGSLTNPEILRKNPTEFAATFLAAIRATMADSRRSRAPLSSEDV